MKSGIGTTDNGKLGPLFDRMGSGDEPPRDGLTLKEARRRLMLRREVGTRCPCCDQFAKVYRRQIHSEMARWLIWCVRFYRKHPRWVRIDECPNVARGGDTGKLRYWGLTIQQEHDDDDGTRRTSGLWRPTDTGIAFVLNKVSVPKYVFLYDGNFLQFGPERIRIQDALGTRFNYEALMNAPLR